MKKLCVISFDACSMEDFLFLRTLPHFNEFCNHACVVEDVNSIFLTNTYPIHTSIITGVYPKDHKIIDNTLLTPFQYKPNWHWDYRDIQHSTLFLEAKKRGLRITNFFWPVCCNLPINENIPEYIAQEHENQMLMMLKKSTPWFLLKNYLKYGRKVKGALQPNLDDFSVASCIESLRKAKSDLITLHLTDVDTQKHQYGIHAKEVKEALVRMDLRLGALFAAGKEHYQFVILSDHAQVDASTTFDLNKALVELGLDQDFWFHQSSGAAFLKPLKKVDQAKLQTIINYCATRSEVKRFLSDEEMMNSGFFDECILGVCAGYGVELNHPAVAHYGNHGYPLDTDHYKVFYAIYSPKVKQQRFSGGDLLDVTPILAKLLEIPTWDMERTYNPNYFK